MDIPGAIETAKPILIAFSLKVVGAIAATSSAHADRLRVGLVMKALERQKVEPTVIRYIGSVITVALNIILVVAILATSGSRRRRSPRWSPASASPWARPGAGCCPTSRRAFILVLRPFKVGDYVVAGDVEGTVRMIGLFNTTIDTPTTSRRWSATPSDGGTIKNFSHNPYAVDLTAQLDHSVDPGDAIRRLKEALPKIANVVPRRSRRRDPHFNERGPVSRCGRTATRALLAGVLRHQPHHSRDLRRGRLSGGRGAPARPPADGLTRRVGAQPGLSASETGWFVPVPASPVSLALNRATDVTDVTSAAIQRAAGMRYNRGVGRHPRPAIFVCARPWTSPRSSPP